MQLISAIHNDIISAAFNSVELYPDRTVSSEGKLHAAGLDAIDAALSDVWNEIRKYVGDVSSKGWSAMQDNFGVIVSYINKAAESLGKQAQLFKERLLEKIRSVIAETFDLVLAALRSTVKIGGDEYKLVTVDLEHKLVYTGSVEVSLKSLCSFVGAGELVVKGSYTPA